MVLASKPTHHPAVARVFGPSGAATESKSEPSTLVELVAPEEVRMRPVALVRRPGLQEAVAGLNFEPSAGLLNLVVVTPFTYLCDNDRANI